MKYISYKKEGDFIFLFPDDGKDPLKINKRFITEVWNLSNEMVEKDREMLKKDMYELHRELIDNTFKLFDKYLYPWTVEEVENLQDEIFLLFKKFMNHNKT